METEYQQKPLLPVWVSIPLYLIVSFIFMGFVNMLIHPFYNILDNSFYLNLTLHVITYFITTIAIAFTAIFFLKYIDRTSVLQLGLDIRGKFRDIVAGILFAVIIYAIGFSVSLLSGSIMISGFEVNGRVLFISLLMFLFVSLTEEIMVRGYILGRMMTKMNRFIALSLSSLLFAIMHIFNPNINLISFINIFLAGIMLGASYIYTRNLWFPVALHLAWNWIQGPLLGYEVSGTNYFPTMFKLSLSEENIINGGSFGFEGSIICTFATIIGSIVIVIFGENYRKKKNKLF